MPANTAKGYPYPLGTDRVMDGDDAIHNLASAIDTKLGAQASGKVTIPVASNNPTYGVAVTYPVGRFVNAPAVSVCCAVNPPTNAVASIGSSGGSVTGVTIFGVRTTGSGTFDVYWQAVDAA